MKAKCQFDSSARFDEGAGWARIAARRKSLQQAALNPESLAKSEETRRIGIIVKIDSTRPSEVDDVDADYPSLRL